MDDKLNAEINALKEDIAILRSDVAGLAENLRHSASSTAENARESVEEEVHRARERLREKIAGARGRSARTMHEMEESIGERPLASVATAVGIGFILAKILDLGTKR
ncbi:DUF883 family protein [Thiohalomonas denitrificans]|uniref:Membrane-anchored ribosome-binding protein, inhibits growth in stationary phase, ElaB/YqjD/DUF883 family n=1 Tax=Thiohalomonas denitrificans TaxID=415747 RepID=A0A1G5Q5I7_9GAMM|nr:DUF883 family protein [Thiohalomonas denitrificans]SCZ57144.1 Membrane-anchored ribosome-binding protein, inhibits growth in stationary phase, ElaB/YqjD/DUF883 family [Thiohalomonas denitrificans]